MESWIHPTNPLPSQPQTPAWSGWGGRRARGARRSGSPRRRWPRWRPACSSSTTPSRTAPSSRPSPTSSPPPPPAPARSPSSPSRLPLGFSPLLLLPLPLPRRENSPPHLDPSARAGVELVPEPEVLAPLQELQGPPDADADQDAAHGVRRAQVASLQGYALCLCALRLALRSFAHVTLAIRSR